MQTQQPNEVVDGMLASGRNDPYLAFNFLVEIDGMIVGGFNEIAGLNIEIEYRQYHEGGGAGVVYHLPTRPKYSHISLSKGISDETALLDWVISTAQGDIKHKQVSVILKSIEPGVKETRWDLANALPQHWKTGVFNAQQSTVAIETLSLVFTSIKRETRRVEAIKTPATA